MLLVVLIGTYRSVTVGIAAYAGQPRAHVWVAPRGTDNVVRSSGMLSAELCDAVAVLPGVAGVHPVLRGFVSAEAGGQSLTLLAIGHRPRHPGGPPVLFAGRGIEARDEIVLDRAAAYRLGVGVGDWLHVGGWPRRVVGLSRRTNLVATQLVFLAYDDLAEHLGSDAAASFLLVELTDARDAQAAARRIAAAQPRASAFAAAAFVANNRRELSAGFLPLLVVVAIIGAGAAVLSISVVTRGLVEERRPEIALLLAIGASTRRVAGGMLAAAGALIACGAVAGVGLARGLALVLDLSLPTVELSPSPGDQLLAGLLAAGAGLISAVMPVVGLGGIEPLEAFRS